MSRMIVYSIALASLLTTATPQVWTGQRPLQFDRIWWESLDKDQHWNFIYGFTDCGAAIQSGLNTAQYEDFISAHVTDTSNSVPSLIRLAPKKVKALKPTPGGEVWTDKHGFNDGDLWGNDLAQGRAWVEGYLACEERPVSLPTVDYYVRLIVKHYKNPKRHLDKLADVLEPLLPPKPTETKQ